MQHYLSPSISGIAETPISLKPANQTERFLNYLIDFIILSIITSLLMLMLTIFFNVIDQNFSNLNVTSGGIFVLLSMGYYFILETYWGKTAAKWITGTKVVNQRGFKPKMSQIFIRTLARLIFYQYLIAFYPFVRKEYPVGWHDLISGTRVIKTEKLS